MQYKQEHDNTVKILHLTVSTKAQTQENAGLQENAFALKWRSLSLKFCTSNSLKTFNTISCRSYFNV